MPTTTRSLLDDPVAFAEDLYGSMDDSLDYTHAPREYAAYKAAHRALCAVLGAAIPCDHPAHLMDEAAHAWNGAAFLNGVRFGIAAEQFRRSLLTMHDAAPCLTCFGSGAVRGARCAECEGDGIAPPRADAA